MTTLCSAAVSSTMSSSDHHPGASMSLHHDPPSRTQTIVSAASLSTILGIVYSHLKTSNGGDLFLTRFGLQYADLLELENWYEKDWFESKRERLEGTSAVYRVPTKTINDRQIDLVVKNCRVGEHVPIETRTLLEFLNAEFNSPWEEFALVFELREGKYGAPEIHCHTQEPLAIYVPPETMQIWQSGRSSEKINRIRVKHPGIDLDILRQYKLIYRWIMGKDVVQLLTECGGAGPWLADELVPLTRKAVRDLESKGYVMVDMKPSHIIIGENDVERIESITAQTEADTCRIRAQVLHDLVSTGVYSVIDYELLMRTEKHERHVTGLRRHSYLDDQRDRFTPTPLPSHLSSIEILGVPYIFGHAESTGGQLWVVGRNSRLFDYFLPERWRRTHSWKLSESSEIFYTVTKDNIHIVWKISRVGETPLSDPSDHLAERKKAYGYNSPFEEFAIAHHCSENGIPSVYMRAIYVTGTAKIEQSSDPRRYESHRSLCDPEGRCILQDNHNYITLRGYFNGPDDWVARQAGLLCRPIDLEQARTKGLVDQALHGRLLRKVTSDLKNIGYDGSLLRGNDLLLALDPDNRLLYNPSGAVEVRISSFECVAKL
ncbi:MAG: hypothetical protein JW768_02690 [Chitinispirillaceae bacterium]|nr:hypothetical protein [Chitinispirillaceae bacterium]